MLQNGLLVEFVVQAPKINRFQEQHENLRENAFGHGKLTIAKAM